MLIDCRAPDAEIKAHALWGAGQVRTLVSSIGHQLGRNQNPTNFCLAEELEKITHRNGAKPPAALYKRHPNIEGVIARMTDAKWWTSNLRRETLRENERQEHEAGQITKKRQCYVTDHAVKIKAERNKANRATLERLEVCNEQGEAFNLLEVSDASVSNPKLRRAELMTRCRGFEEAAQFMGHKGLFLTLTTPKRFHRKDKNGYDVKKWIDASPKDGQKYLCKLWTRIRAAWKRAGIAPYGFRVAEPHQDGTPHWHLLLFVDAAHVRAMLAIAAHHALAENRHESGANKHRFTVKRIDPSRGSATGYIAKYICKNIDGTTEAGEILALDGKDDDADTPQDLAALRVRTWAATWGIRQFQQIGGPSVSVWRELRRLGEDAEALQLELFEKPRAAASRGAWFDFWMLQGGPEVSKSELTLKPFYKEDDLGKYGDLTKKIKGVLGTDGQDEYVEITRLKDWTVQPAGMAAIEAHQAAWDESLQFKAAHPKFLAVYEDAEFKRLNEVERTRTGINNCTPPTFDFSSFALSDPNETEHLYRKGDQADPMTAFNDVWADEKAAQRMADKWEPYVKPTTDRTLDPVYAHLQ